ncbi:hypothetical protein HGM15179_019025, partial [Zosterops borbonicus]
MGGARAGALLRAEPPGTQKLRVQRIGDQYRALRWSLGGGDTAGEGPQVEPVALSPRHRGWVDACAGLFGGVDICGVEALRGPDGQEHIVQVLGSWLPLLGPGAAEDRSRIVELVLERMREELPRPRSPSPARPLPQLVAGGQFRVVKEPLGFLKLLEWVYFEAPSCGAGPPERVFLVGDHSSAAQFFVTVGVGSFLYAPAALGGYLFAPQAYRAGGRAPRIDLGVTTTLTFNGLVNSRGDFGLGFGVFGVSGSS